MTKYRAIPTVVDNVRFASKKEAARYLELKTLAKCGIIRDLELQIPFALKVNGILVATYVCDFRYTDASMNRTVIEDTKGMRTPVYKLKAKLFAACYPDLRIVEL